MGDTRSVDCSSYSTCILALQWPLDNLPFRAKHTCTHHWGFTSEPYHQRSRNAAGGSRNVRGVRGTLAGFVDPFGVL